MNLKDSILSKIANRIKIIIYKKKLAKFIPNQPRQDDIYLVSFPRSGNTWVSFLIGNVIKEYLSLNVNINFNTVRAIIPDIHMSKHIPSNMYLFPFRRIIKSHCKYNPFYNTTFLIVREPKDVLLSYYSYLKNKNKFEGTFKTFVYNQKFGLNTWLTHTEGWLKNVKTHQRLYIIRFKDLKNDSDKVLRYIFKMMGFEIDKEIIKKATNESKLKKMREYEYLSSGYSFYKYKEFNFIRKGKTRKEQNEFSEDLKEYIEVESKEILQKIDNFVNYTMTNIK